MNWRNVGLIFKREIRDQLRDRRTLFMVFLLPLILYPIMGIGMTGMTVTFTEQTRTVLVANAGDLPQPPLIEKGRFVDRYFNSPFDAEKVRVITDDTADQSGLSDAERRMIAELPSRMGAIREISEVTRKLHDGSARNAEERTTLENRLDTLRQQLSGWFEKAPVQVLLVIPPGFRERLESINAMLAAREGHPESLDLVEHPILLENSADEKSQIAFRRVREGVTSWEHEILNNRLKQAGLPKSLPTPVDAVIVDVARKEKVAANIWSKMLPALLVVMAVTGAFYPAIDLGAGEKERGTMETLLISPASRREIVMGKFLTVMSFSISTAVLNLVSIGFTGRHMLSMRTGAQNPIADMTIPPVDAVLWVLLLAIPLAALFSALSLAFAMFARSTKEGQYYLTPLLMVTIGLMMFSTNPSVELTPFYSVMPVVGPSLLLKVLLQGSLAGAAIPFYAVAVTVSSVCYSLLALWWAIEQFQREDVLFREAERFDLKLWLKHLLREKEAIPSFSEALFCFLLILLLQFASLNVMQNQLVGANGPASETRMLQLQIVYLLATVGTPALLMAVLLTGNPLKTLKLCPFHPKWLIAGLILPLTLQPLSIELLRHLAWFFPELPAGAAKMLDAASSKNLPLWLALLAFAITPAICEELAFRGFILSGLQRTHRYRLAAVMSSVAFGIVHTLPQQVFNATLLGLVLAALALRSGSLIPGVLFHFVFNATQVVVMRLNLEGADVSEAWLRKAPDGQLVFGWPLLAVCAILSTAMLYWLVTGPVAKGWRDERRTDDRLDSLSPDLAVR